MSGRQSSATDAGLALVLAGSSIRRAAAAVGVVPSTIWRALVRYRARQAKGAQT